MDYRVRRIQQRQNCERRASHDGTLRYEVDVGCGALITGAVGVPMKDYGIVLTVGAREAVREMRQAEKQQLARALRRELFDDDGAVVAPHALIKPTGSAAGYRTRALSSGHVVVFRPMEEQELKELAHERHEPVAPAGVIVYDILSSSTLRAGSVVSIEGEEL